MVFLKITIWKPPGKKTHKNVSPDISLILLDMFKDSKCNYYADITH